LGVAELQREVREGHPSRRTRAPLKLQQPPARSTPPTPCHPSRGIRAPLKRRPDRGALVVADGHPSRRTPAPLKHLAGLRERVVPGVTRIVRLGLHCSTRVIATAENTGEGLPPRLARAPLKLVRLGINQRLAQDHPSRRTRAPLRGEAIGLAVAIDRRHATTRDVAPRKRCSPTLMACNRCS